MASVTYQRVVDVRKVNPGLNDCRDCIGCVFRETKGERVSVNDGAHYGKWERSCSCDPGNLPFDTVITVGVPKEEALLWLL